MLVNKVTKMRFFHLFFFFHIFWHPFSHSSVYEETIPLMKHISLQKSALIFFCPFFLYNFLCKSLRLFVGWAALHFYSRIRTSVASHASWDYLSKYKFVLLFFLYIYSWFIWRDLVRSLWLVKKEQCSQANKRVYETEMEGNSEGSFRQVVHRRFLFRKGDFKNVSAFPWPLYPLSMKTKR